MGEYCGSGGGDDGGCTVEEQTRKGQGEKRKDSAVEEQSAEE